MVERHLRGLAGRKKPSSVYEPIRYVLSSGGKRLRAVLVLMACEATGGRRSDALDAAVAMEVLHNFTLVHDDVMDHAELRRKLPTIHARWDENVAILSGDALIALAYQSLLRTRTSRLRELLEVFTDAFLQVCEGQGLDKEFELRRDVTLREYSLMIRKKTARMIQAAVEIGAIVGAARPREMEALRRFGYHLGMAFQMKDDLLDITGSEEEFGKRIGGDIVEGKKTMLLLLALERATGNDRRLLQSIEPGAVADRQTILRVRDIYERKGVLQFVADRIVLETLRSRRALSSLNPSPAVSMLSWTADQLVDRQQ